MNPFTQHIGDLLKGNVCTSNLPVATPFEGFFLPDKNLIVQYIPLDLPVGLPDTFFASLSDEAQQKGLKIIHLWEDVYRRQKVLVEARLLSIIGIRKRIHARQTVIKRIDKQEALDFLSQHHVQGYVSAYYKYALLHAGEIIAVATFSKARVMNDGAVPYRSYELIRFASKTGITVTGGLGKLLHYFIAQYHPAHLMTYADRDWSNGDGYTKLGFAEIGKTSPQLFWVDTHTLVRTPYSGNQQPGFVKVMNAGNLKFALDRRT